MSVSWMKLDPCDHVVAVELLWSLIFFQLI